MRAHVAARQLGLPLIVGSEFLWGDVRIVALARDLQGWGDLCEFISAARARAAKGGYRVDAQSPWALLQGCELLLAPRREVFTDASDLIAISACLESARGLFCYKCWLAVELHMALDDGLWLRTLAQAGARLGLPLVAAGDVHMHARAAKPLQDVITAVRLGRRVADCGFALQPHAEQRLRPRSQLAGLYPPALLAATLAVAARCSFSLHEIKYRYPLETVLPGMTAQQTLAWLTWEGAHARYPAGVPERVQAQIGKELDLIADCGYEMYFLTVHDIVRYARSQGILCQGRGSAANSVVCYCLGITAVDPRHAHLLFERFISKERSEPPDIDVDFEHERREEVIQYIYAKYGRERAALTAVVISYRTRSALRDVGKALGLAPALVDAFAKDHHWFDEVLAVDHLQALAASLGEDLPAHQAALWLELTRRLRGFPRHLSQHVGGFVLTQGKLTRLVPVEPAAMPGRSIIQWDKDDLDAMGLLKVDVLALGMLSALRRCLDARALLRGERWGLADIPREDAATYDMICRADTVGVFQIESRAQMSMLPRLQPRSFYDLVVQVAIVRPGPDPGRHGAPLPAGARAPALAGAWRAIPAGIPAAGRGAGAHAGRAHLPGAGDADRHRRRGLHAGRGRCAAPLHGRLETHGRRAPVRGALQARPAATRLSAGVCRPPVPADPGLWRIRLSRKPRLQLCPAGLRQQLAQAPRAGLLSGGAAQLPAHGLLRPVSAGAGRAPPRRARAAHRRCGERLGLHAGGTFGARARRATAPARRAPGPAAGGGPAPGRRPSGWCARAPQRPFASTEDLALRARLDRQDLQALAAADALRALSGHRRQQMWDAAAQHRAPAAAAATRPCTKPALQLPAAPEGEDILFDYAATGLTLRRHPLALLRAHLARWRIATALQLRDIPRGRRVRACGIVTVRQRPGTAQGTMFVTLEDETGPVNVIVWPAQLERWRDALMRARLLAVEGVWQCSDAPDAGMAVRHLVGQRFKDLSPLLGRLAQALGGSRDFH